MTRIVNNTGNQEHYTPPRFIEAARNTMTSIDLDPASNEIANKTVKAKVFYSKDNCGLDKEWSGNVWLNPPYDSKTLKLFINKLVNSPYINQAIVLLNNNTETVIGQTMLKYASAICLVKSRTKFLTPEGTESKHNSLQGQIVYYYGNYEEKFKDEFSNIGVVFVKG